MAGSVGGRVRAGICGAVAGYTRSDLLHSELLRRTGPQLRRPHADTLKGSDHANMKELRFDAADGVWRVAFAFDPERNAVLLLAGDKSGGCQKCFYREFLRKADGRYSAHLHRLKERK